MMHARPRTLLWRLFFALVALQIALAAALAWYTYRSITAFHHTQAMHELDRLMPLLARDYASLLATQPAETELEHRVRADSALAGGIRITLIREDGLVIADAYHDAAAMENHLGRPEVAAAMREGRGDSIRHSDTVNRPMVFVASPMTTETGDRFILRIAIPLTQIEADVAAMLRALAASAIVWLAATIGLIYLVSRHLSGTVYSLAEQTARLASSDADPRRLPQPAIRELSPLVEALNRMAERLRDRLAQLGAQQREHEAILQSMSNGVLAIDLQQRILRTNRAAETLLELNGVTSRGRLLQEVVRHSELNRYIADAIADPQTTTAELTTRGNSGRILQAASERMTDAQGKTIGLLIVLNDVTELRRLESIRSDFAANVSHELRTPITNIKGYVETLLDVGVDDPEQTTRFLEIVKRNCDRLASIIEDTLSLAWLEQPDTREVLLVEPTEIAPLIAGVTAQFEGAAAAKSIRITTDVAPELTATINRQLIEQAVANFVSNAVKYSPNNTTVIIRAAPAEADAAEPDRRQIEIAVSDEGPGIPKEHLSRVFERFYRVDKARSRKLGGTGLGLAIVKHIALVHGGRVDATSAPGKGSTFRLYLPR